MDTLVDYSLQFENTYEIPQGGSIEIVIPEGIGMDITSSVVCSFSINGASDADLGTTPCTASALGSAHKVVFGSVAGSVISAGSTIKLKVDQVFTNPIDTGTVSSFEIFTYYSDQTLIESLETGISIKMASPAQMTPISVTRSNFINSDESVVYEIKLTQQVDLVAGNILYVTFPSDIEVTSSVSCTDLQSVNTLSCTEPSANLVKIPLQSNYPAGAEFGAIISGVINPPSTAPLNEDYEFRTESSSGLVQYG